MALEKPKNTMQNCYLSGLSLGSIPPGSLLNVIFTGEAVNLQTSRHIYAHKVSSRVNQLITGKNTWKDYDVFAQQKANALAASSNAVRELSTRYLLLDLPTSSSSPLSEARPESDAAYLLFAEMTEIALWGNATDLSLLSKLSLDQIQSLQGAKAIKEGQARIVSNDTRAAWKYLCSKGGAGRIDIVLDNSGFELFTDLVYCLYLLDAGLASEIILHPKSIPWFVSDVTPPDVGILLSTLFESAEFRDNSGHAQVLAQKLKDRLADGLIKVKEHRFWSTGFDFQEMFEEAPDLFETLCKSTLVVFKGDLNYRKLVRDATWAHSTPFKSALGSLCGGHSKTIDGASRSEPKILALRTNKADVCVGVPEGTVQRLETEAPGKAWVRNGKYAVISFSDGI